MKFRACFSATPCACGLEKGDGKTTAQPISMQFHAASTRANTAVNFFHGGLIPTSQAVAVVEGIMSATSSKNKCSEPRKLELHCVFLLAVQRKRHNNRPDESDRQMRKSRPPHGGPQKSEVVELSQYLLGESGSGHGV